MRHVFSAAIVVCVVCSAAGDAVSQTSVIQQSVIVGGESSSVTISGQTVTVDTQVGNVGRVVGNGQPASEERPISPVTSISSDGAFELTIRVGAAPGLTIKTDKNILPIVKTVVSNGRLDIYTDRSYSVDGRIKVTVSSPDITDISASGSNRINGEGFAGNSLSMSLSGSNNAVLIGRVSALTCHMSGSNHLTAQQLTADSANLTVSGSGDASVDARQQIVAEISGAGAIAVYGNPKARSTRVNGAGKITFIE